MTALDDLWNVAYVENGVRLLDATFGRDEWIEHIDWNKLDIYSLNDCIIGQMETGLPGRFEVLEKLGLQSFDGSYVYGFETPPNYRTGRTHYTQLNEAWVEWAHKHGYTK